MTTFHLQLHSLWLSSAPLVGPKLSCLRTLHLSQVELCDDSLEDILSLCPNLQVSMSTLSPESPTLPLLFRGRVKGTMEDDVKTKVKQNRELLKKIT